MPATSEIAKHRRQPVLSLSDGVLMLRTSYHETVRLTLDVGAGELVLLHISDDYAEDAIVQAICGLFPPLSGAIRFHGHDWTGLSPDRANALRGRIGIVFRDDTWIPYRSMMDNLMLPQLHHTRRPFEDIRRDAATWTSRFGLPGLPLDLPAALTAHDRNCANFARAFIGAPSLIVVEDQSDARLRELRPVLVNAIRDARDRGTAVIWFTRHLSVGQDATLPATHRLQLGHTALQPLEVSP